MEKKEPSKAEHQEATASNGVHLPETRRQWSLPTRRTEHTYVSKFEEKLEALAAWQAARKEEHGGLTKTLLSECFIHKRHIGNRSYVNQLGRNAQTHKFKFPDQTFNLHDWTRHLRQR